MSARIRPSVIALLGAYLLAAVPSRAQVRVADQRGWIGVSVELLTTVGAGRSSSVVTVTDVSDDSPASRAGIRPGDVLVSLNGRPGMVLVGIGQDGIRIDRGIDIRPGERVEVVLLRDGAEHHVSVLADRRPPDFRVATTWSFEMREDSVADRIFRAMDSLKVRMFRGDGHDVAVVERLPGVETRVEIVRGPEVTLRQDGRTVVRSEPFGIPVAGGFAEIRSPFALLVLEGTARDSLRQELQRIDTRLRETRELQALRVRHLTAASGRVNADDAELRRLDREITELRRRAARVQEAIESAARAELHARPFWAAEEHEEPGALPYRPLAPYVVGQNRAAGAGIVDLQPELAAYFGVEGGVLVVDVMDGTPAALAGIRPGDVLTHLNDARIASIGELRSGLARASADAAVRLVRNGRPLTVTLLR